jgi:UDP-N-acetylglucosamine--N-acetylmuramyl-(pentapeptide) pyrophosphoryl-undecaprenol N-acetylglucosamine transferase
MNKKLQRVLIMAGGTGGHVFPGLAFAAYLKAQGVEVSWLGTSKGIEATVIPEAGIPLHLITIQGVRGKGFVTLLRTPFRLWTAVRQAMRIMRDIKPDVVVGMGGFVSVPGGIASLFLRVPLIIHEQNAKVGLANRLLSRLARRCLAGFETAFQGRPRTTTVGNPVREELESLPPPSERLMPPRSPFHLLVLGGSLGAKALNDIVPEALSQMPVSQRPEVWHQTGSLHLDETRKIYENMGIKVNLIPFIKDMAAAYAWADVVLCRAGALTVAELCAVGLGAIVVPYPFAVDDHQTANAETLVRCGAAQCIQQAELRADQLAQQLKALADSPNLRLNMAEAAYARRRVKVVQNMYDICQEAYH